MSSQLITLRLCIILTDMDTVMYKILFTVYVKERIHQCMLRKVSHQWHNVRLCKNLFLDTVSLSSLKSFHDDNLLWELYTLISVSVTLIKFQSGGGGDLETENHACLTSSYPTDFKLCMILTEMIMSIIVEVISAFFLLFWSVFFNFFLGKIIYMFASSETALLSTFLLCCFTFKAKALKLSDSIPFQACCVCSKFCDLIHFKVAGEWKTWIKVTFFPPSYLM